MHEAIVTKIKVQPHPNPEVHSLAVGYLFGETIIVSKDTKDGDLGIYFPCELQLGEEFAEKNDLIRRKNEDGTSAGGMFDPNRRVRVQKFKGVKSNGFWCPISYLAKLGDVSTLKEGDKLTTFNGYEICRKYVTPETFSRNKNKIVARKDSIWFPKHKDTEQFKYNLRDFRAGDVCVVTLKTHGTSQRVARTYDEYPLTWRDKVLSWLGLKRDRKFLRNYNGTRNVTLKGQDNGFYSESFREAAADRLYPFLEDHMQIFFEVVGWEGPGAQIMPSHDADKLKDKEVKRLYGKTITYSYGCEPGTFDIYVYRIAYVLPNGEIVDLTSDQVKKKCEGWGVKTCPELDRFVFDGNVDALVERIDALSEGPDLIDPRHPREGVVIRIDSSKWQAYKSKSFVFKCLEGICKEDDSYVDQEEVS
jgi:hypothetical protein